MTRGQLKKKIARLESINDHLETEMEQVDSLMRLVGFANGIQTVKVVAQELLKGDPTTEEDGEES